MLVNQLKSGVILCGPSFPEPVQVILVTPLGQSIKLIGKGLTTGKRHGPILSAGRWAHPEAPTGTGIIGPCVFGSCAPGASAAGRPRAA
jgi:hypothetical protein